MKKNCVMQLLKETMFSFMRNLNRSFGMLVEKQQMSRKERLLRKKYRHMKMTIGPSEDDHSQNRGQKVVLAGFLASGGPSGSRDKMAALSPGGKRTKQEAAAVAVWKLRYAMLAPGMGGAGKLLVLIQEPFVVSKKKSPFTTHLLEVTLASVLTLEYNEELDPGVCRLKEPSGPPQAFTSLVVQAGPFPCSCEH
ncbi:hypothetical protein WISP_14529 [Willisornis vidua]|uniref:Uncharacterized protein n=1 Tax=Willisornis vidua TaxID=1566151 RepID=A0ABQ9DQG5_9PASS|nr:hypothetical protein WISP_14529 [Willisornis vidua]